MIRSVAVLALFLLFGCTQQDRPIDEHLMAALGQARALHHQADVYLAEGEVDRALRTVERVLEIRFPRGSAEGQDVRTDAFGRIARIHLGQGRLDAALRTIHQGLSSNRRDSFYVAELHAIRGEIHETRAKRALEAGDRTSARAENRKAIQEYETSIKVNQRVLDRILRAGDE